MGCAVGLGKTLISLGITYTCKKTVVIVPASLKDNYKREVEKFTNKKAFVIKKWQDSEKIPEGIDIIILNYEIIEKCSKVFIGADAIVCDEIQKVSNPMAKMSKDLYSIVLNNKPKYFVGLSGTITNGKVGHFFQLLRLCSLNKEDCGLRLQDDKRYNIHFRFQQFFSHEKSNGFGSKFYGLKNYPELKNLLKKKYISKTVEENLPEMPNIIRQFKQVNVKFDSEQERMLLQGFEKSSINEGELTTIKRLHAESKVEGTYTFIRELLEQNEKVIVFSDHILPTTKLYEMFISDGIKCSLINGDTKIEDRQKQVNDFQEGENEVFIATIPTANSGFTLTSSSIVVFLDCSWNPAHLIQCEARARRIGQTRTVRAFFMVNGKVDKIIIKTLLQKLKVMNIINTDSKSTNYEIME
jgi:SNF2 family DNA or RNA helicase